MMLVVMDSHIEVTHSIEINQVPVNPNAPVQYFRNALNSKPELMCDAQQEINFNRASYK